VKTLTYLYETDGSQREINLDGAALKNLNDKQLLWTNVLERDKETVEFIAKALQLSKVPIKGILRTSERPKIYKFKDFYHFFIISVETEENGKLRSIPIDFLVGKNFVVTVHNGDVKYLQEFERRERGEINIGDLDAESFVATMLDLHIASYFRALEKIDRAVDILDERILKKDLDDNEFLEQTIKLRSYVSKLRRWFLPHRDIFYALSRPDFKQIANSDSYESFQMLNEHFENAVVSIESSRDSVISLFDLYTTKTSHNTNKNMQRLTFITLMAGSLGVVAGIFGMNFEVAYFKSAETGFWLTILGMAFIVICIMGFAKFKHWI